MFDVVSNLNNVFTVNTDINKYNFHAQSTVNGFVGKTWLLEVLVNCFHKKNANGKLLINNNGMKKVC